MAFFALTMLQMSLELALHNRAYEDMASKFLEHFLRIKHAIFGGDLFSDDAEEIAEQTVGQRGDADGTDADARAALAASASAASGRTATTASAGSTDGSGAGRAASRSTRQMGLWDDRDGFFYDAIRVTKDDLVEEAARAEMR